MTIAADLAGTYAYVDSENVTFAPQNPAAPAVNSVKALRRPLNRMDLMGIGIEPTDIVFNLWVSTLGGSAATVKNGDKITDAGSVSYLIQTAKLNAGAIWRCICRKTA